MVFSKEKMNSSSVPSPVDFLAPAEPKIAARARFELEAGWRYGLVFGIALVLVAWGVDASELALESAALFWPKLLLATLIVLPLCTAAGAYAGKSYSMLGRRLLVWLLVGAIIGGITMHIPFEGASAVAALIDPAVRGLTIFPFPPAVEERVLPMVLITAVAALVVGVLQSLAGTWAWNSSSKEDRMTLGSWLALVVSVPVAIAVGSLHDGAANAQLRAPLYLTNRVIQLALNTPADLNLQSMETLTLLDYLATSRWRSEFSGHFKQHLVDYDRSKLRSGYADVEFDNGFIWRCEVVRNGDGFGVCSDLRADYTAWMAGFFRTGSVSCENCSVRVEPGASGWQSQAQSRLGDPKQMSIEHHSGGVVQVRSIFSTGMQAECRLVGADPVVIQQCETK